jgi:putative glutamine amidotransferase
MPPLIGITCDNRDNTADSGVYECAIAYARAVADAGGLPVLLPHHVALVEAYVERCDGVLLTGGVDPDTRVFGQRLHPMSRVMDPTRQAFEAALLAAAAAADRACLGVCLGMQMMALSAGGRLDPYLPDTLGDEATAAHQHNRRHTVVVRVGDAAVPADGRPVVSSHRQAVADAGRLRVVATAPDGVIEAIDDPSHRFFVGVQWHPERGVNAGDSPGLNAGLIRAFVDAARASR